MFFRNISCKLLKLLDLHTVVINFNQEYFVGSEKKKEKNQRTFLRNNGQLTSSSILRNIYIKHLKLV